MYQSWFRINSYTYSYFYLLQKPVGGISVLPPLGFLKPRKPKDKDTSEHDRSIRETDISQAELEKLDRLEKLEKRESTPVDGDGAILRGKKVSRIFIGSSAWLFLCFWREIDKL